MICAMCGNKEIKAQDEICLDGTVYFKALCCKCGCLTALFPAGSPNNEPSYFVHLPGRGEPKYAHDNERSAIEEAQRLVSKHNQTGLVYRRIATINPVTKTEVKYG